jgi:HlyD family secretion protein
MKKLILIVVLFAAIGCSKNERSDAYGNFEATEVTVSSEVNGRIIFFNVEEGMSLVAGDVIGLIDTTDLYLKKVHLITTRKAIKTRIASIESQIKVQEQQKENLLVDQRRINKMFKEGAATQKQVDDIEGALRVIENQIEATRIQKIGVVAEMETIDIQVKQVDEGLHKSQIRNPTDGVILAKYAEVGEISAFGKPLYKIANLTELELKVFISGDQLPYLKLGQQVEVLIDKDVNSNMELQGTVSWISQKAEFTPKTIQTKEERVNLVYAAKVKVKNDGTLKIGMPGEINFMPVTEKE